ncbi:hypothetical protein QNH39_12925 [Neobacillus novalis]|uniref:Uncharacterized protein n=1 Tax=Neobacillus novalis TaxID=220687 RepID=A0AA95SJG4_9BACI|nr:hypothetical protein [Neobacillus novalis]WHY88676.1 hypothetical protein QNH39_12925 [Neobacillus novalis]
MKKVSIFIGWIIGVVIMLVSSKLAANYYAIHANIDPLSKSASLLTLLFMLFFFLGSSVTGVYMFIFRKQHPR